MYKVWPQGMTPKSLLALAIIQPHKALVRVYPTRPEPFWVTHGVWNLVDNCFVDVTQNKSEAQRKICHLVDLKTEAMPIGLSMESFAVVLHNTLGNSSSI